MAPRPGVASDRPAEGSVDEGDFKQALRHFASGVTVITTRDEKGLTHGMTATAFCSLSLRPPLILVAVARGTRCHALVTSERCFGVSILHGGQADLSRHFGGKPASGFKPDFAILGDVPVLKGAMVTLACSLRDAVEGGDHSIFTALVTKAATAPGEPLVHFDGRYRILSRPPEPIKG